MRQWRRAVLVTGVLEQFFCKYIWTAITQSFWSNKDMTLAATISIAEQYTHDDLHQALDRIKLNARSRLRRIQHNRHIINIFSQRLCSRVSLSVGDADDDSKM